MPGLHCFKVEGGGQFPLDMLRYDRCYPRTSNDAGKIYESLSASSGRREIELLTESSLSPTVKRWNSFMWKVIESE